MDDLMACERCGTLAHPDEFEPVDPDDKLVCAACRAEFCDDIRTAMAAWNLMGTCAGQVERA